MKLSLMRYSKKNVFDRLLPKSKGGVKRIVEEKVVFSKVAIPTHIYDNETLHTI